MKIAIIDYPDSQKSTIYGLQDMFILADRICKEQDHPTQFEVTTLNLEEVLEQSDIRTIYTAVILPPSLEQGYYLAPEQSLLDWLLNQYHAGGILCSVCAGTFILAATGLLKEREATTHWGLAELFSQTFADVKLNPDKILVNEGDIITSGGMMSWIDLGLELVAQFSTPSIMRQLGKVLVVDTGQRKQQYYRQFNPDFQHGDPGILQAQKIIQREYGTSISIKELARKCNLSERTFLRRFIKVTGKSPLQYIQNIRIQKACDLLENTTDTFEMIVRRIGYEDISACRKTFVKIMGLTPVEFRKRFVGGRDIE